jgi:Holliday junction DNA helicase RuvB
MGITEKGAHEIAKRSRGTPRIVNKLLRRTRDFAQVENEDTITDTIADNALNALDVDQNGLDEMDIRILESIVENYEGGPVGLSTIGVAVGEDKGTVEEVYEPFLIQQGFLQRTPKGRVATKRAFEYLGISPDERNPGLFD